MEFRAFPPVVLVAAFLGVSGCSGPSRIDDSDAGKSMSYQTGTASYDIEAVPLRGENDSGIELFFSIPPPSLTFTKIPEGFRARCEISAKLTGREAGEFVNELAWTETTLVERYELTQRSNPLVFSRRIVSGPGKYIVEVVLEDLNSGRKGIRSQAVTVMDPNTGQPAIGRVFLEMAQPDGRVIPRISFHVPAVADSLRCAVDICNVPRSDGLPVGMQVLKFHADTLWALPPFAYSLITIPKVSRFVDFDRPDTLFRTASRVSVTGRKQTLTFFPPPLREGLYRFDIRVTTVSPTAPSAETSLVASRFYSIKGSTFPRPSVLTELIDAAAYIAKAGEMAEMRSSRTAQAQRTRFEAFWLNLVKDQNLAATLIRRYYSRVEEANRLFTTIRDGWRTDQGMLYIILGPPGQVINQFDTQTWVYDLPGGEILNTYIFKRVIRQGEGLTVEEFILYRGSTYEMFWNRMVSRWRSGLGV